MSASVSRQRQIQPRTNTSEERLTGRTRRRVNPRPKHARRLGVLEVEPLLEDAAQVTVGLAARLNVAVGPFANLAGSLRAVEPREKGSATFSFPIRGRGSCQSGGCGCPG